MSLCGLATVTLQMVASGPRTVCIRPVVHRRAQGQDEGERPVNAIRFHNCEFRATVVLGPAPAFWLSMRLKQVHVRDVGQQRSE